MVCVRGVRPTCKTGVDGRAALYRVLLGFDQQRAAALTDDKAVAVRVERTAGVLGIIVAARKRLGLRETGYNDRAEDALAANGEHSIRLAGVQQHGRGHDRVTACRAGRVERQTGAVNAVRDSDLRGSDVADGHRNEARTDALALIEGSLRLRNGGNAVHRGTHDDADAVGLALDAQTAVRDCLLGGDEGELHERVHRARERFRHIGGRIEILELRRDLHGHFRCVKARDFAHTARSFLERVPVFADADADRCHGAHAGDDQIVLFHDCSPFIIVMRRRIL